MKARIIKAENELKLLLCNGKIKTVSTDDIIEFINTYTNKDNYSLEDDYSFDMSKDIENYVGETIVTVSDDYNLTFHSEDFFFKNYIPKKPDYLTAKQFAEKHNRHFEVIRRYCRSGKIPSAKYENNTWYIPVNASCPVDGRSTRTVRK